MEAHRSRNESVIAPELYFLITKFLGSGPCQETAEVLKRELERAKILPQRIDWEGNLHNQTFEELERRYHHIGANHLLQICARIGPILEKDVPPCIPGAVSLLGAGRQSLLRTKEDFLRQIFSILAYSVRIGGKPFFDPPGPTIRHNIVRVIQGRENSGPLTRRQAIPTSFYSKMQLYRHTLGHLSAVYCVLFDRTGKYIITGADDRLVKVWSAIDGRLLATFRGASSEIMDIAVNFNNTLLAAGSLDKILRVWCFQTMSPVAVLSGHSGMITSVIFCPIKCNGLNYLVSTSSDGSVAFWPHTRNGTERTVFQQKPIQYHEKMRPGQAQMMCASFSPGGAFMAAGSADHNVRVYAMLGDEGPRRVLEVEAHADTVDSIQWAHHGLRFISGSKDGTANVWHFEQQQWVNRRLVMTTKLPGEPEGDDDSNKKAKVTMVGWDVSDEWVITAVNDNSLKVWDAKTGDLRQVLKGHLDEVFVLESHPVDSRVLLSAGHDGQLIIWDILSTQPIACFENFIEGQGRGAVFDAKWAPDGTMLAATDSHGHLLLYGFGSGIDRLKVIPKELFFHTDYRPLMRDSNHYVLDEQTQTAPHLMPPPFLVDVDGNPYPPSLQQLVPGRENCRGEQLVPNIAVGAGGMQEVIEGLPGHEPRSNIDRLIEALAQRQNIHVEAENVDVVGDNDNQGEPQIRQIASPRASRPGLRRAGDVEGVRQSSGNWQRDNTTPWNKPILARPLSYTVLRSVTKTRNAMAEMELEHWRREMRRRPQPTETPTDASGRPLRPGLANRKRNRGTRHGYRTRAARGEEREDEEFENPDNIDITGSSASSNNSNDSSAHEEDLCSDSSSSDSSSEYSDWIADHGVNLEPPKRSKRRPVKKRSVTPPSDSDRRRSQRPKKEIARVPNGIGEVPEAFRPPEWLSEVIPRKAPYYPQMGDEIVYFRQGHQFYLDAVRNKKVYELGPRCEPWSKMTIRAQEFVKVVGIKYEIRPPRLCCLKLAVMDEDGRLTGDNFTIKYHDMADVLDFLVLRQTFETALARSWSENDRFRCMIDDGWWMGQIQSMEPLDDSFPESFFMCFRVRWDNGEFERMSPWDLEPVDGERLPAEVGGAVPVLPEEIEATLYQPHAEEWPMGDREATCRRIIRGLDQVMILAIAEPFVAPVDLNIYPAYAFVVEYPIDLSTIKARFDNHFYRRITSAQFDVRYLATNAEQFNEPHSQIVKQARIVTDLCLRIIKETTEIDVPAVYHQLVDTYQSSDSDDEVVDKNRPSTSGAKPTSSRSLRSQESIQDWKVACRQLLETLWACEDSLPFREPVDRLEHPDYYQIIDTPMDLRTVKEDLQGGNYETPLEFAKDIRLIFTNSKNFNTNKRSMIYSMTIRLSAMFEEHMPRIIYNWKSARRRKEISNGLARGKTRKTARLTNGAGPSRVRVARSVKYKEEDEESSNNENNDDDDGSPSPPTNKRSQNSDTPGPSRLANGHANRTRSTARPTIRLRISRKAAPKNNSVSDSEASDSEASMESESSDSAPARKTRPKRGVVSNGVEDSESEDSYKPGGRGKQTRRNRAKNGNASRQAKSKPKSFVVVDDDDEEEEEEEEEEARFQKLESSDEGSESEEVVQRTSTRQLRKPASSPDSKRVVVPAEEDKEDEDEEDDSDESKSKDEDSDEDSDEKVSQKPSNISQRLRSNIEDSDDSDASDEEVVAPSRTERKVTRTSRAGDSDSQDGILSSRRSVKRPRYNVESDESNSAPVRNRRKIKRRYYNEDSDESVPADSRISVSSRGRVRKMTARAHAFLRESP